MNKRLLVAFILVSLTMPVLLAYMPISVTHAIGNIGYELLDNNKVLRIWNAYDSYYFNVSSGIQFSNHYQEFWSHNLFLIGYYDGETWHKVYSTDELSGFDKIIESDNATYVNATLWKDLTYGGYDFRVALRYHLKTSDKNLTIQPYCKNLGKPIPLVLGFAWKVNDIKINSNIENDQITINGTSYLLNQTCDITYKSMASASYYIEDVTDKFRERLDLSWSKNLDYIVWVKSEANQYNAPVTLGIKVGTLDIGQEKTTIFYWHDATTENLFVNSLDSTYVEWSTYGTSPYLGDNNDYIYTDVNDERHGYFGFADLGGQVDSLTSVTISCEAKAMAAGLKIDVYIYDGSWHNVGQLSGLTSSYDYYDIDISSLMNTVSKINNCKAYFQADLSSAYDVYIRRAKLVVIYTPVSDTVKPTYSNVGTSTTDVRASCTFYVKWSDNAALDGYIFGTNNTQTGELGFWNDTWTKWDPSGTPKWSNITETLHTNVGIRIEWRVWANDTSNNWNNTGIQYFITTGSGYWGPPSETLSWHGPTGCDYISGWFDEENIFDNSTSNYGRAEILCEPLWGDYIYLNYYYAITCDKIRFYAHDSSSEHSHIDIDVKRDGAWIDVYAGDYSENVWVEKTFSAGAVTNARVRGQNTVAPYPPAVLYLHEVQFWGGATNFPTNDALTLDLTGASFKGTKTLLTAKQDYKFVYKCSDTDGVTTITYAEIRLDFASKNVILRATRGTGDAWTFSEQSDPSNYVTLNTSGSSHSTSGNQKTFNFLVKINWNWDDATETIGVRCYVIDSQSASDTDDYTNVFGVENDLSASSLTVNDYRVNPSQTLTFSGYWYYQGTSIYPPDGDYQVKIKLSGVQKGSTDTTLVSGAFSINDVTAESTVNSYSYTVEATYMASAGSFSAVIVERVVITISANATYPWVNDVVGFTITGIYEYDSTTVTSWTVNILRNGTHFATGNFTDVHSSPIVYSYTTENVTATTYGITSFTSNTVTVTWRQSYHVNLHAVDWEGNPLTQAIIYMNNGTQYSKTVNSQGWANWTDILAATVNVYATWYGYTVNSTFSITMGADRTIDVTCKTYPFMLSGTRYWIAGNATVNSYSWNDTTKKFVMTFTGATNTYTLKSSAPTQPTYILNATFDLDTDWTTYLTLTHYGNRTITLGYPNWNGIRIHRTDHIVTNIYVGEDEKLYVILSGVTAQSGTLEIYCGGRGTPQATSGLTDPVYFASTNILSGTYTFSSTVTVWVSWQSGSSGESTGSSQPSIFFSAQSITLGSIQQGTSKTFDASASWTGGLSITIVNVKFSGEGSEWFKCLLTLPYDARRSVLTLDGTATIPIVLTVPKDAKLGNYEVQAEYTVNVGYQSSTTSASITFTIVATPVSPIGIPTMVTAFLLIAMLGVVALGFKKY